MSLNTHAKLLSICLAGRNDNYGGKFQARLERAVNYLAMQAKRIGQLQSIEVVITDWNSSTPLVNVLCLTPEAAEICHFIQVSPEIAGQLNHPGSDFHTTRAINVATRRALGEFIWFMPADILIPQIALSQVFKLISGEIETPFDVRKSIMLIPRKFLPQEFNDDIVDWRNFDKYLLLNENYLQYESIMHGVAGSAGAILVHSELMHELHGFEESMGGWGRSDIDFGLKANLNYPTIPVSFYGITVYDFALAPKRLDAKLSLMNNCSVYEFRSQNEKWGLADYILPEQKPAPSTSVNAGSLTKSIKNHSPENGDNWWSGMINPDIRGEVLSNFNKAIRYIPSHCFPLFWLVKYRKCFKYLDIGNQCIISASIVSRLNSCAEIYCALPLSTCIPDAHNASLESFSEALHVLKHQGYVRFITGSPDTALDRLGRSFIGTMKFDLMLCNCDVLNNPIATITQLLTLASPQGAIILISNDSIKFPCIVNQVKLQYPELNILVCFTYRTALIIKSGTSGKIAELDEKTLCKTWVPFERNTIKTGIKKILRNIKKYIPTRISAIILHMNKTHA